MLILCLETSTDACSAALTSNGSVLTLGGQRLCRLQSSGAEHARQLPLFADEILRLAAADGLRPEAVAVSAGPGSYTGLRIGASFAKGLAYGLHLPLIAVPTLQVMSAGALNVCNRSIITPSTLFCPLMDARRMEVYTAVYDAMLAEKKPAWAEVVNEDSFSKELQSGRVVFFGNGMSKCRNILDKHNNALFIEDIVPDAAYMGTLAGQLLASGHTADVAYWTPAYLKEFEAKHSVVKGL